MPQFDLPVADLEQYRPEIAQPADFDGFWRQTLEASRAAALTVTSSGPTITRVDSPISAVRIHDLQFPGFAGDPVRAWVVAPAELEHPVPAVVEFLGYGNGRGLPHERLAFAASGYAHIIMDTRGQNSPHSSGATTPDPHGTGPSVAGFLTRGIESPESYYYRRVFTDAVRCVEAVAAIPWIDPARIAVSGTSQGGGIALAAAGLLAEKVAAALIDVPFLCHFDRAITLTDREPYAEISRYLAVQRGQVETTLETLSYFDGANHATRATAPALFSVGLFDSVCPPSTVYAARNRYGGPSGIDVYPFNGHEGGAHERWPAHVAFLDRVLPR